MVCSFKYFFSPSIEASIIAFKYSYVNVFINLQPKFCYILFIFGKGLQLYKCQFLKMKFSYLSLAKKATVVFCILILHTATLLYAVINLIIFQQILKGFPCISSMNTTSFISSFPLLRTCSLCLILMTMILKNVKREHQQQASLSYC